MNRADIIYIIIVVGLPLAALRYIYLGLCTYINPLTGKREKWK